MKKVLLLVFLMVVFPAAYAKVDKQHHHHRHHHHHHHGHHHHGHHHHGHHHHRHHHHHHACKCHHKPGHFYCKRDGRFKPHYQYAIFDQKRFDCKPGVIYKHAFYRYYNEYGMSAEYYIP